MTKKIRRERATRYDYVIKSIHDEEVDALGYLYNEKTYDESGRLTREISYDASGEVQEHLTYRYDDQGRRVEMRSFYGDDQDSLIEGISYTYDDSDQPVSAVKQYADGSEDQILYKYNDAKKLVEKRVLNDEGEQEELEQWRYEKGLEVWYERRDFEEPVFREEQEYDNQGRLSVVTLWEAETERTVFHKLFYNDEGLRNRIEKYDDQGKLVSVIEIPAFAKGEPLEMTENVGGRVSTNKYDYDESGNLTRHIELNPAGEVVTEVVKTYDESGRLLSTEVTNDRQGMGMNQRYRIEYEYE